MTEAGARPKPRIDHPEELDRMVKQIVAKVDPVGIGSRARGDAHPDSDYDLLIVIPDEFPEGQANTVTAFSLVEGRRIPMDITMSRTSRFAARRRQIGTLEYKVGREGVVLHERSDSFVSGSTMSRPTSMRPGVAVADRGRGSIAPPICSSKPRRRW